MGGSSCEVHEDPWLHRGQGEYDYSMTHDLLI